MRRCLWAASCLLLLTVQATASPIVTRGPYLQQNTDHRVVVRWRTDTATPSWVRYGATPGPLNLAAVDTALVTEHEVYVLGLAPLTHYAYTVGDDVEPLSSEASFHTHPVPGTDASARIWILGDSGSGTSTAEMVRNGYTAHAAGAETDVWVMLGDNAYNTGTDAEYQAGVFDMYPQYLASTSLWPARGNHDQDHAGPYNDYAELFTLPDSGQAGGVPSGHEGYYSFDYGDIHFVCLDSEQGDLTPPSDMLTWLQDDLDANTRLWTVGYAHHGPYSKGSHDSDDSLESGGRHWKMRAYVLPILEEKGVDLFLAGHSHSYERSFLIDEHYDVSSTLVDSMLLDDGTGDPHVDGAYVKPTAGPAAHEGTVYVIAGASSKVGPGTYDHPVMATSLNELGSLVLRVDGPYLFGTYVDVYGDERDSFTIIKGVATGVGDDFQVHITPVALSPPFPNPFHQSVRFQVSSLRAVDARINVYDVQGRLVQQLFEGLLPEGPQTLEWNGESRHGRAPGGVYWIRVNAGEQSATRKVLLAP